MCKAVDAFRWSRGLCALSMIALLLLLTACAAADWEQTLSAAATAVAEAPDDDDPDVPPGEADAVASPSDEPVAVNWQDYPDLLALPDEDTLIGLQASLAEAVRFQLSQGQASAFRKLPLPPDLIDLDLVVEVLNEIYDNLITPVVIDLVINEDLTSLFTLDRPTTYLLPDEGVLFQVVTWQQEYMEDLVEPYLDVETLQGEAFGQYLFVGLIVAYQTVGFEEGLALERGTYVVLLRSDGDQFLFELAGPSAAEGEWVLRQRETETWRPYTFLTYGQICFSGMRRQACLQLTMEGFGQTEERVLAEAERLVEAGLLPDVENWEERINARVSFADLAGPETIDACLRSLLEDDDDNCSPSLVAAAIEPFFESVGSDANPATGEAWPGSLRNAIFGSMLLSVPDDLQGLILDESLDAAVLPEDVYRLDLLLLDTGERIQIGQLTGAQSGARYYVPIEPVQVEGELIYPPQEETRPNEILLRSIIDGLCTNENVSGYKPACESPKERTPWCVWINGCD